MRNKLIIIAAIFAFATGANAQNADEAKNVLRLCREKCQSIKGGHYESEYRTKYMDFKDTSTVRLICDYKKQPSDKVFKKLFANGIEREGRTSYYIYTGKEYILCYNNEAIIMTCDRWIDEIMEMRHSAKFYKVLTEPDASPMPNDEALANALITYSLTETTLDGKPCYTVDCVRTKFEPNMSGMQTIRIYKQILIDRESYLPLQFTSVIDLKEGEDTLCQYEQYKLLSFDSTINESRFTLDAIPAGATMMDYVPDDEVEPLSKGKKAPKWTLPTLKGDTISLSDFRGKVVLVDFFYRKCAPCNAAMPVLQRLHEKYKDQGVVVIGIDPIDDPVKDNMADFLAKRGIDYTVVFSDRELPQKYHVTGYPTLFFINEKGKIEKVHEGFSQTMEQELEEQIQKMLKK
ncbi:MAG: TlpA family protein disulfide reductase [Bacteroidales bacterium]|nr:TlpA family protein disulfide reductase [Bacteroidales bacterium]